MACERSKNQEVELLEQGFIQGRGKGVNPPPPPPQILEKTMISYVLTNIVFRSINLTL